MITKTKAQKDTANTYEFQIGETIYKSRNKCEAYAVASVAHKLSMSINEFRKVAQVRLVTATFTSGWHSIW
jgi:hypothetical protein